MFFDAAFVRSTIPSAWVNILKASLTVHAARMHGSSCAAIWGVPQTQAVSVSSHVELPTAEIRHGSCVC